MGEVIVAELIDGHDVAERFHLRNRQHGALCDVRNDTFSRVAQRTRFLDIADGHRSVPSERFPNQFPFTRKRAYQAPELSSRSYTSSTGTAFLSMDELLSGIKDSAR